MTALMRAQDEEEGGGMEDTALRDELMTLLVAGQETSAILLGWLAAELAWHPRVQERAAQEVEVGPWMYNSTLCGCNCCPILDVAYVPCIVLFDMSAPWPFCSKL